jgi:hypothetical protein
MESSVYKATTEIFLKSCVLGNYAAGRPILNRPELKWRPGMANTASNGDRASVTECPPALPHLHPLQRVLIAYWLLGHYYSD